MALEGASANLGSESREWVATVERLILEQQRTIARLEGELRAVVR
ncbi:hypothetical protein BKA24_001801 [Microbacterium marinum]|uniref:Uncharacterized protein n=1 Tax=Microbacterium marinum TaxID=421115 RepID=A0A7W7BQQ3_9MICO|nr:hypothetical protein [Microbacterium marinum]MBB4667092.1 hypothetical protein [Microbacterium marinum]